MAMHITRTGVTLTVGIIVLTALLIGGLFWVKNAGEQARHDQAITAAEETLKNETDNSPIAKEDEKGSESNDNSADNGNVVSSGSSSSTSASNLPETGTSEVFITALLLGLVAYAMAIYFQSRRASSIKRTNPSTKGGV